MKRRCVSAGMILCLALAGCASAPGVREGENNDPFEPLNRAIFDANDAIDVAVLKPLAEGYRAVVPEFVRDRIRAFVDNLQEPRIFANDLLQGRVNAAGITFARFYVNYAVWAGRHVRRGDGPRLPRQSGDFGETLYFWGGTGPYLVLPLFGPSNVRDAFGLAVDLYTTPPAHLFTGAPGSA